MSPWIKWIGLADEEVTGTLKSLYDAALNRAGKVFHIVKVMSLRPRQMKSSMAFYRTLMYEDSSLSRAEREMLATAVSTINGCHY